MCHNLKTSELSCVRFMCLFNLYLFSKMITLWLLYIAINKNASGLVLRLHVGSECVWVGGQRPVHEITPLLVNTASYRARGKKSIDANPRSSNDAIRANFIPNRWRAWRTAPRGGALLPLLGHRPRSPYDTWDRRRPCCSSRGLLVLHWCFGLLIAIKYCVFA